MAPAERSRLLLRVASALLEQQELLAQIESRDTGKPLKQARADAAAVARYFEFYAGAVDKLHGATIPYPQDYIVLTVREPHGVTGHRSEEHPSELQSLMRTSAAVFWLQNKQKQ